MLTSDETRQAAERLDIAERTRKQTEILSIQYPHMTMDDAYAVQSAWVKKKIAAG
ncbi:2-oxo-hepta-3-ene-1,7-dioic acid hydratase, partial [Rhizobium ruizarguesonis]